MKKQDQSLPSTALESRRQFLKVSTVATSAAAIGFPMISKAALRTTLRFQTAWPANDMFFEFALDYARKVDEMSDGKLRIHMLPANAVVPAMKIIEAVHQGTVDGSHAGPVYWFAYNPAYSLFGSGPSFGMDADMMLGWLEFGGGKELYAELNNKIMRFNVHGMLFGPMPTQPLGWFKKPVTGPDDLKGLRYRTVGLPAEMFREMGVDAVIMPVTEVLSALKSGKLDAAEFNNPSSDLDLGIWKARKIYMIQSYHQPAEIFEVLVNKARFHSLPHEQQAMLRYAGQASSTEMSWKAMQRYSRDLIKLRTEHHVQVIKTPRSVLKAQLTAWDKVIAKHSHDPFFVKVIASQKAWAKRVVNWHMETDVAPILAYQHYFGV